MNINKDEYITRIADKTGFYKRDIKKVLSAIDDYISEIASDIPNDDKVKLHILDSVRLVFSIRPEHEMFNYIKQEDVIVRPKASIKAKVLPRFVEDAQRKLDEKNGIEVDAE